MLAAFLGRFGTRQELIEAYIQSQKRSIDVSELKGICVPICTPFKENGAVLDEGALGANIDSLIDAGIHIIAVNGGTGEFPFLTEKEKRRIAEIAGKRIGGRAKLIVQTSALRTEDAIDNSKHAEGAGADALLVLPPFFEGPGEAESAIIMSRFPRP
ncbi:MAG: hypothetical protein EOR54_22240 [Mesorhizobium sp.]|nr:MAG: hypothetical protein EOR54_22240 [Mesorhizobium sp.]